ncbi:beta strand repeat-containing protein [Acidithiobacillus ferriphilus]|uniref:beta strand repeat-containing protein n=1 Tax=Acidithiobacillus ferriphilus TaxID=1689834 RepID=UPI001C07BE49|nr:hypothetical protein [Acidithiobacillus ferriphilus]
MSKNHKMNLRPIVGAMIMALAAPAAMAAVTPPAANSLPGNFYSNQGTNVATYAATSNSAATITFNTAGPVVFQWGGTGDGSTTNSVTLGTASGNPATNAGFDIGAGATLKVSNASAATAAVLISDITGNPSQIYGAVSAPTSVLYIANGNGVIVGSGATLTVPEGAALIGYNQDPAAFAALSGATVNSATATNKGDVTVAQGVTFAGTPGFLLVAGAGNVNVGTSVASQAIFAGYGFSANNATNAALAATSVTSGSAIVSTATLNLSGTLNYSANTSLAAAGNVNVLSGANVTMSPTASTAIGGAFSNAANVTLTNNLTAGSIVNSGTLNGTGAAFSLAATGTAGIVNNGVINASGAGLTFTATSGASAPITNNGVISNVTGALAMNASGLAANNGTVNFSAGSNSLGVTGANVNFYGTVNQGGSALSATNVLTSGVTLETPSTSAGVLNLSSSLFASGASTLQGAAVRVLTGGLTNTANTLTVNVGSGVVGTYGYNLSLFPGTTLAAPSVTVAGATGSNINLDGVLGNSSTSTIDVSSGGTINGSGGFSLATNGALNATFAGNFNNPNGAAAAGKPGVFQYNYVPVNANGGLATITLDPTNTAAAAQMVNLLVTGNADLESSLTAPLTVGGSTAVNSTYQNSHLVLQATGNLTIGSSASVYWPGLVYLGNINAGSPGSLSTAGKITISHNLDNALAANVTGNGGIFFMTDNALTLGSNTVLTNTNSWVNFPVSSGLAPSYAKLNTQFNGAVINSSTPGVISTQLLPAGDFQGR